VTRTRPPLQNRVTPFGEIVATPARGMFVGNRGIIHDPATRTLLNRRWSNPAWLVCVCDWKGRRRQVMGPGSWTELFFLDEATALSAGHRPCFECRRADAIRFRDAWTRGRGQTTPPRADEIDRALHAERLDGRAKRRHALIAPNSTAPTSTALTSTALTSTALALPDGAMVARGEQAFLIAGGRARLWSPFGYGPAVAPPADLELLTPPSTVEALRQGYRPALHPSATS
jgi:hypothetical protein